MIDKFQKGSLKTEEVFDIDQLAKGFAASDILDGWHGINWTNMSFYLNPISLKLEPIFQDWYNARAIFLTQTKIYKDISDILMFIIMVYFIKIFSHQKNF